METDQSQTRDKLMYWRGYTAAMLFQRDDYQQLLKDTDKAIRLFFGVLPSFLHTVEGNDVNVKAPNKEILLSVLREINAIASPEALFNCVEYKEWKII